MAPMVTKKITAGGIRCTRLRIFSAIEMSSVTDSAGTGKDVGDDDDGGHEQERQADAGDDAADEELADRGVGQRHRR